jgi:hypothetical protein
MPEKFLEYTIDLKIRFRTHHRTETYRNGIMKLLAFFLLQGLHKKPDNMSYSSRRKILEASIFLDLFSESSFHLLLEFLHFVDNEKVQLREIR